ncbi:MAG: TlpA family protein disulfide reductase [Selenomonadaceae bacterium]|nr:TlpA family protein disulfide reductase [Selenomonadaceae bacterium]
MTKKIFAALLAAGLLLSGCGDNSADVNNSPNTAQASPVAKSVPSFTAKTIKGETVTNEIFASKKITVVNIWGTFCPPCIAEMPELGEMARSLPADAQIIGLVCDATEDSAQQIKKAQEITHQSNANFVNIIPDEQLLRFMENVEAVPTTIFVNSKGEVVGKAIIGADVEGYKSELEKLLKQ